MHFIKALKGRKDTVEGVQISVLVQPGAKSSSFVGVHGDRLKFRIAAPPVDGAANEALLAFVAQWLGLSRRNVGLKSGEQSRQKEVLAYGRCLEEIRQLILASFPKQ